MKRELVINEIKIEPSGKAQFTCSINKLPFFYIAFSEKKDWARIGDRIIVEVTNVDAESSRQHGE